MSCCDASSNGQATSADPLSSFGDTRETTDGALQSLRVAALPIVGAAVSVYATFVGMQDGGETYGRFNFWWDAARNGVGSAELVSGTIANGYTDPAALPFTTPGFPPAWPIPALVIAANIVSVTWAGAVGQVVRWRVTGTRSLVGGATP